MQRTVAAVLLLLASTAPVSAQTLRAVEDGGDVVLSWDLPVPTQEVLRSTDPGGPFAVIGQSASGQYRDVGAIAGGPFYAYQIRELVQPIGDVLLAVQAGADVQLAWSMSTPGAVEVQRATDPAGPFVALGQTAAVTFSEANAVLDPAELLVYRLVAVGGGPTPPSNYAFRLNRQLTPGADPSLSSLNLLGPPYLFFPDGDVGNRSPSAEDLCTALNGGDPQAGSPVFSVARWDTARWNWTTKPCSNPWPGFTLRAGEAYGVVLDRSVTTPVTVTLVGSHDDRYAANKGGTLTIELAYDRFGFSASLIALPYHIMAADSEELCTLVNGGDPMADTPLARLSSVLPEDLLRFKFCVNPIPSPAFGIGEGLHLGPGGNASQQIQFDVY